MTPEEYRGYLETSAAEDGLGPSALRVVPLTTIMAVEIDLELALPEDYKKFLFDVGVGEENGGLGLWFDFSPGSSQYALSQRDRLPADGDASRMLPIYDAYDGDLYGFLPNGKRRFENSVYTWSETGELRQVADSFASFLDLLAEEGLGGDSDSQGDSHSDGDSDGEFDFADLMSS
jgi:hypothetical protein